MREPESNRGLWSRLKPRQGNLRIWQAGMLILFFVIWHVLTVPGILPPFYFDDASKAAFFFGEPLKVLGRVWQWFSSGEIFEHLWVTLWETLLAFVIGTVSGLVVGLWLALNPIASALCDPYIKALNSMPRVILAPIFSVWFGLDIASKVALGVTLVFSLCSSTSIKACAKSARRCLPMRASSARATGSCCAMSMCRAQ